MAFLKPTKLKTDNKPRVNYVDSFIDDSIEFNKELSIEIHKEMERRKEEQWHNLLFGIEELKS